MTTTGGKQYLGRFHKYKTDDFAGVIEDFEKEKVFELLPVIDYFSPLRPVQGPGGKVGLSRDPIVTQHEFTTTPTCIKYVKISDVLFLDEMDNNDRKTYRAFIDSALRAMIESRAQQSGLVLANTMPKKD